MRVRGKEPVDNTGFFKLKDKNWLDRQRIAGKVAADSLILLKNLVKEKTQLSLLELNSIVEQFIEKNGCQPTFKGYKGFPCGVCMSVNKQLVHGIPTDYKLVNGDVISFDLGATFEGAIADTAITIIYGEGKKEHIKMVEACEEALFKGIKSIEVGKRLGSIGYAINQYTKNSGFSSITQYGGHHLDWNQPHAAPFVANKAKLDEGFRMQAGLSFAIEPMLVCGRSDYTFIDKDGWTVNAADIASHFEHSVYLHEDHVEIMTYRGDEKYLKSNKIYFGEK